MGGTRSSGSVGAGGGGGAAPAAPLTGIAADLATIFDREQLSLQMSFLADEANLAGQTKKKFYDTMIGEFGPETAKQLRDLGTYEAFRPQKVSGPVVDSLVGQVLAEFPELANKKTAIFNYGGGLRKGRDAVDYFVTLQSGVQWPSADARKAVIKAIVQSWKN